MKYESVDISPEIAETIANELIKRGIGDNLNNRNVSLIFPLPEDKWEASLALRSLDMALALYDLSMQRSYHKHVDDEEEYEFWERFSEEVNKVLEEKNLFDLVIAEMI